MNILEIASRKIWNLHFVYLFHTYSGSDNCSGEAVGAADSFVFCKPTDTEVSASVLAEVEYPSIMSFSVVFSLVCLWLWIILPKEWIKIWSILLAEFHIAHLLMYIILSICCLRWFVEKQRLCLFTIFIFIY